METECVVCSGARVVHGEVLFADDIASLFDGKVKRATVNRWLAGQLLRGCASPGLRGRWITVASFVADMRKLGCTFDLPTECPGCGGALDGYLIQPQVLDAQDIVDYFSNRASLETVQMWFTRRLLRGRKTPGIRSYWTTTGEFLEDVGKLKAGRSAITPRVVIAHG